MSSGLRTLNDHPASAKLIKDRLQEIDPRLGVCLVPDRDAPGGCWWAITYWWDENDPRRASIRDGSLPVDHAFDVIVYLPKDCSVDEAYGYLVSRFKAWSGSRDDIRKMLDRVHHYNRQVREATLAPVRELAEELTEANAPTLFADRGKTTVRSTQRGHRSGKDERDYRDFLRDTGLGV